MRISTNRISPFQNFSEDLSAVQSKWLSGDRNRDSAAGGGGIGQDPRTPDIEGRKNISIT